MTAAVDQSHRRISFDDLIACPGCDLLHHRQEIAVGEYASCHRCGDVLQTRKPHTIDRSLAVVLSGIVLLMLSLTQPFLTLTRSGINSTISVLDAVEALWFGGMRWLGLFTLAFIILLPLARLLLLAWVLGRLQFGSKVRTSMRVAFRWAEKLEPWAMVDIFMVGVVVSLVKISTLANMQVGLAFWALLGLAGLSLLINITLCRDTVWTRLKPTI